LFDNNGKVILKNSNLLHYEWLLNLSVR
jgi:hypothetical protein